MWGQITLSLEENKITINLKSLSKIVFQDGKPQPVHYPWVNLSNDANPGQKECTKAENHAKELFMCGQIDMIAIGGG